MFKTVKRIIDWCGEFKGRLYAGFVVSFFSHLFTALPIMLAAYTIGLLLQSAMDGTPFDTGWVWKSLILLLVLVFLRFLFDYLRARFQEAISYELVARDRLAVGDALKRVSLGYFQQVSTGNILNSLTTGLGTLEGMGIRMIDNFVGSYLNFAVVFLSLLVFSPRTAVIALAAAAVSLVFLLAISHYSAQNAPWKRRPTGIWCHSGIRPGSCGGQIFRQRRRCAGHHPPVHRRQQEHPPEDRMGLSALQRTAPAGP